MHRAFRGRFIAIAAVLLPFAAGCVTYKDLAVDLDRAIGKTPGEVSFPPLNRVLRITETTQMRTVLYLLSGPCRWEFDISVSTGKVVAWRYPDEAAAERCSSLARTRP